MKKWVIRAAIAVVVLIVLVLVAAFVFLDSIVKKGVETVGPAITKTPVRLEGAKISPFSGGGELKGFVVGNPEGFKTPSAIQVGSVAVSVVPSSVMGEKVKVRSVRVVGPEINFEGDLKGNNLSKLLDNVQGTEKETPDTKEEQKAKSRKLQVDDLLITGAKVHVTSSLLAGKTVTVTIPEIHFSNLGQGPEGITPAELTSKVLKEVTAESIKAATKAIGDVGKNVTEAAKGLGTNAAGAVEKGAKGVLDIFKKDPK